MTDDSSTPHLRRPRYQGTHPRAFHEKYKELDPDRYAEDVAKVTASGKTPAGSHRPIMVREVLDVLALAPGQFAIDATLGYGGHASALLEAVQPGGRLLAIDVDPIEVRKAEVRLRARAVTPESLIVRQGNFAALPRLLAEDSLPAADAVIADLGLSSMQIDDPARGFTYKRPGPLDLRMNPHRGHPASTLLASISAAKLTRLLDENADQPDAERLAEALVAHQSRCPITRTTELADAVREAVHAGPRSSGDEAETSIRRVFQALRIAVNDEFGALQTFLHGLPQCLAPGGRVAILTFHSGEDRRVKRALRDGASAGIYASVAETVGRATAEERRANPRAASAKLRWAIRA